MPEPGHTLSIDPSDYFCSNDNTELAQPVQQARRPHMSDSAAPPTPATVTAAPTPTEAPGRSRLWSILAGLLGVLAVIGVFASTVAIWTSNVLSDSDQVAAAVDDALVQPEVNAALATYLTDQVFIVIDAESRISSVLPPALQRLEPAIVGGAHSFVDRGLQTLLARDDVRALISSLVRTSHAALVKLLNGEGLVDGITVNNGEVTINLLPLISRGLQTAQGLGLFDDVTIPEATRSGDPATQISELEAAFGRDLPEDFGQLVVYSSEALADRQESLSAAQHAVVVAKRATWLIVAITVVSLAASILVAQRRRRAAVVLGLAIAAVMLVSRTVVQNVVDQIPSLVVSPAARAALSASVHRLVSGLLRAISAVLLASAITALVAFLMGDSKVALSTRSHLGTARGSLRSVVAEHRDGTALALFGVAVLIIILFGLSIASLVIALLFALGGAVAMWGIRQPAAIE